MSINIFSHDQHTLYVQCVLVATENIDRYHDVKPSGIFRTKTVSYSATISQLTYVLTEYECCHILVLFITASVMADYEVRALYALLFYRADEHS
jgi:hypothetical protein